VVCLVHCPFMKEACFSLPQKRSASLILPSCSLLMVMSLDVHIGIILIPHTRYTYHGGVWDGLGFSLFGWEGDFVSSASHSVCDL